MLTCLFFTESSELEGTHKDDQVQPLTDLTHDLLAPRSKQMN